MTRLPAFLRAAHGAQERQHRWDAQSRRDDCQCSSCGIPHVFVGMINIRPHRTDHVCQTGRLGEIADNLAALDTHIVVLINQQRLNHHENTMDVGPHKLIEFVQNTVNDLD